MLGKAYNGAKQKGFGWVNTPGQIQNVWSGWIPFKNHIDLSVIHTPCLVFDSWKTKNYPQVSMSHKVTILDFRSGFIFDVRFLFYSNESKIMSSEGCCLYNVLVTNHVEHVDLPT